MLCSFFSLLRVQRLLARLTRWVETSSRKFWNVKHSSVASCQKQIFLMYPYKTYSYAWSKFFCCCETVFSGTHKAALMAFSFINVINFLAGEAQRNKNDNARWSKRSRWRKFHESAREFYKLYITRVANYNRLTNWERSHWSSKKVLSGVESRRLLCPQNFVAILIALWMS